MSFRAFVLSIFAIYMVFGLQIGFAFEREIKRDLTFDGPDFTATLIIKNTKLEVMVIEEATSDRYCEVTFSKQVIRLDESAEIKLHCEPLAKENFVTRSTTVKLKDGSKYHYVVNATRRKKCDLAVGEKIGKTLQKAKSQNQGPACQTKH